MLREFDGKAAVSAASKVLHYLIAGADVRARCCSTRLREGVTWGRGAGCVRALLCILRALVYHGGCEALRVVAERRVLHVGKTCRMLQKYAGGGREVREGGTCALDPQQARLLQRQGT